MTLSKYRHQLVITNPYLTYERNEDIISMKLRHSKFWTLGQFLAKQQKQYSYEDTLFGDQINVYS